MINEYQSHTFLLHTFSLFHTCNLLSHFDLNLLQKFGQKVFTLSLDTSIPTDPISYSVWYKRNSNIYLIALNNSE